MEAASTSETLVKFYQTTRRYNPEDSHLRSHRRENLKSYLMLLKLIRLFFCGQVRLERETDHSSPSTAKVKNAWNYNSIPKYAFMTWCLIKYCDNLIFTFTIISYSFSLHASLVIWIWMYGWCTKWNDEIENSQIKINHHPAFVSDYLSYFITSFKIILFNHRDHQIEETSYMMKNC
jgi:hypothetical protein